MDCNHERLRAIGDRLFCIACNKELPIEFLETRNASLNVQEPVKNPSNDAKTDKHTTKKRTTKKTEKKEE